MVHLFKGRYTSNLFIYLIGITNFLVSILSHGFSIISCIIIDKNRQTINDVKIILVFLCLLYQENTQKYLVILKQKN